MPQPYIVVVGASTGGVGALQALVRELPPELPAAIFVVLHTAPQFGSELPQILGAAGALPARHARDRECINPGTILVAPP